MQTTPSSTSIAPIHVIDHTQLGATDILSATPNPAGDSVFILADREMINLSLVLHDYWAWVATALAAFIIVLAARRIRSVVTRPQRRGTRYCRRCNYDLSGRADAAAPCPECGAPLSGRAVVSGRSIRRRLITGLWPLALLAAGAIAITAYMLTAPPPIGLTSLWVEDAVNSLGVPIPKRLMMTRQAIIEIDLASGAPISTSAIERTAPCGWIVAVPDGDALIASSARRFAFVRLSARSGRVLNQIAGPQTIESAHGRHYDQMPHLCGFSADNSEAYLYGAAEASTPRTRVFAWRFGDNSITEVLSTPAIVQGYWTRPHQVVSLSGSRPRFVSFAPGGATLHDGTTERSFDTGIHAENWHREQVAASPDGSTLVVVSRDNTMWKVDLPSLTALPPTPLVDDNVGELVGFSPDGGLLAISDLLAVPIPAYKGRYPPIPEWARCRVRIRDMASGTWLAPLEHPCKYGDFDAAAFAGRGRFMIGLQRDMTSRHPVHWGPYRLIIWRIDTSVPAPPSPVPNP